MIKIDFTSEDNKYNYPANDIGVSKLFIDCYKDELVFCNENGCWYYWNDKYWQKDTKDGGIRNEKMKDFAIYCNTKLINITLDDQNSNYMRKFYAKLYNKSYRDTIIKDAASISPVPYSIFDKNIYLFNCQNGTYDFSSNTFKKHDRLDYITNISNIVYDQTATCPRFEKYLNEVMEGNQDKIDYLLKMASYGYTGETYRDCFFVLYGSKTRNGKSTFVNINTYMLGTYAGNLRPASVTRRQVNNGGSSASPDIAGIKDSRWVTISEIENGMMLDISLIKTMTGKNELKARMLYENDITFIPKFKLYFDTNFLPKMTDDTIFQSDRIHLIEFTHHFELDERDLTLADKLKAESSGIFNLIIKYYNKLKTDGFVIPNESKETIQRYRLNSNNILAFKTTQLYEDKTNYVKSSQLYDEYKRWCENEELKYLSKKNFKEEMIKLGAYYTDSESHKNNDGIYEKTFWVKGFTFDPQTSIKSDNDSKIIPLGKIDNPFD